MTPQYEPTTIEAALVVLDAVLAGRVEEVRADLEKLYAVALALLPKKRKQTANRWSGKIGVRVTVNHEQQEVDYACMFCRESLATLDCNGRTLPKPFLDKLERHTIECACRQVIGGGR